MFFSVLHFCLNRKKTTLIENLEAPTRYLVQRTGNCVKNFTFFDIWLEFPYYWEATNERIAPYELLVQEICHKSLRGVEVKRDCFENIAITFKEKKNCVNLH